MVEQNRGRSDRPRPRALARNPSAGARPIRNGSPRCNGRSTCNALSRQTVTSDRSWTIGSADIDPKSSLALSSSLCYCVIMKNITVSVDEETYRRARMTAAERDTSVSALVKSFLIDLSSEESTPAASNARNASFARSSMPSPPAIVCRVMTPTGVANDGPTFSRHKYLPTPSAATRPKPPNVIVRLSSSTQAIMHCPYKSFRNSTFRRPVRPDPIHCHTISRRDLFALGCASGCRRSQCRS